MTEAIPIKTGIWIDKSSESTVLGATLTLHVRQANYLITFLALIVTACASFVWIILAFILHQLLVRGPVSTVFDLQRQILLRNTGGPLGIVVAYAKLYTAWRGRSKAILVPKIAFVAVPALIVWIIFAVASIFVAEVASKSYEQIAVLAAPGQCGIFSPWNDPISVLAANLQKNRVETTAAQQYANAHYADESFSQASHSIYPAAILPYRAENSTTCPWDDLCALGSIGAFSLETPPLDSHTIFGINGRVEDRVSIQKNLTCSVIAVEDFVSTLPEPESTYQNLDWLYYRLGPTVVGGIKDQITWRHLRDVALTEVEYQLGSVQCNKAMKYGC